MPGIEKMDATPHTRAAESTPSLVHKVHAWSSMRGGRVFDGSMRMVEIVD